MSSQKSFSQATQIAASGVDLSAEQTGDLIDQMLQGQASDDEIGQLLLALRKKGESVSELVGAATAMRRHMTKIPHRHKVLLDTCGTGGSGSGTFNISTAVAIVAAACGVAVAKHGNRKATSLTGSADVLEELGVRIESDAPLGCPATRFPRDLLLLCCEIASRDAARGLGSSQTRCEDSVQSAGAALQSGGRHASTSRDFQF